MGVSAALCFRVFGGRARLTAAGLTKLMSEEPVPGSGPARDVRVGPDPGTAGPDPGTAGPDPGTAVRPGRAIRPPRHRAMAVGAVIAAVGVVLLLVAAGWWWRARPLPDVGTGAVGALVAARSAGASGGVPVPTPAITGAATPGGGGPASTAPAVPVRPAALPTAAEPVVVPVRLMVPALHVTAPVVPAGVDATGQFAVPQSVAVVGWYEFGPGLDAAGGAVALAGHVDGAGQGPGALFELRTLGVGDLITVVGSDGHTYRFTVVAREEFPKTRIDLSHYLGWTGARRLTLLTCGGPFDAQTRHYRDNVVVTAVPVGAT